MKFKDLMNEELDEGLLDKIRILLGADPDIIAFNNRYAKKFERKEDILKTLDKVIPKYAMHSKEWEKLVKCYEYIAKTPYVPTYKERRKAT